MATSSFLVALNVSLRPGHPTAVRRSVSQDPTRPSAHSSLPSWRLTDISFKMYRTKTERPSPHPTPWGQTYAVALPSADGTPDLEVAPTRNPDGIPNPLSLHSTTRRWGSLLDSTTHYPQNSTHCHHPELSPTWDLGVGLTTCVRVSAAAPKRPPWFSAGPLAAKAVHLTPWMLKPLHWPSGCLQLAFGSA